jgi:hypothetical protein
LADSGNSSPVLGKTLNMRLVLCETYAVNAAGLLKSKIKKVFHDSLNTLFCKKNSNSVLLESLKPTMDSWFRPHASITIVSSGGGSTATNFNGYRQVPPSAVSICKYASDLEVQLTKSKEDPTSFSVLTDDSHK